MCAFTRDERYLVVGRKPWNRAAFDTTLSALPGCWRYIGAKEDLDVASVSDFDPRYVFFLHWSWVVPEEIVEQFECVCFHMTDLPYGRGGSPLQNLVARGHRTTVLTAFRMTSGIDEGPVYLKKDLSLEGSAEEIFLRASDLSVEMIQYLISRNPEPEPQSGEPVFFVRRSPAESEFPPDLGNLQSVYDHIRMLDAEGYPHAFLRYGNFRIEFSQAVFRKGVIVANVKILEEA